MDEIALNKTVANIGRMLSHSYIIVSEEDDSVDKIITKLKSQLGVKISDLLIISTKEEKTLKISQIRLIQKKLGFKPEGSLNLVCLIGAESLTLEAANSLLKILEEPPPRSLIILFCKNAGKLLPTITSRSVKITIRSSGQKTNQEYVQILINLQKTQKIYQKLKLVDEILAKEIDIEKLLTNWLFCLRNSVEIYNNQVLGKIIYQYLQKYSSKKNQKLFLENLILSIPDYKIKLVN